MVVLFRTTSAQVTLEEANAMLAEFDTDIVMEDGDDTGRGNIIFFFFFNLPFLSKFLNNNYLLKLHREVTGILR